MILSSPSSRQAQGPQGLASPSHPHKTLEPTQEDISETSETSRLTEISEQPVPPTSNKKKEKSKDKSKHKKTHKKFSVEAHKTKQQKWGLGLAKDKPVITRIQPESPFIQTRLRVGHRIRAINCVQIDDMPMNELVALVAAASASEHLKLKVVATSKTKKKPETHTTKQSKDHHSSTRNNTHNKSYTVRVTKSSPTEPLRLSLKELSDGSIMVSRISDNSPFAKAGLRVGDTIGAVNGVLCHQRVNQVIDLLRNAPETLTITVSEPAPSAYTVRVTKPTTGQPIGLGFRQINGNTIAVSTMAPDSPFQTTRLLLGHVVQAVNGQPCADMSPQAVSGVIRTTTPGQTITLQVTVPEKLLLPLLKAAEKEQTQVLAQNTSPESAPATAPLASRSITSHVDFMLVANLTVILKEGGNGKSYQVTCKCPNVYHAKNGSLKNNIMWGCCGQCFKFNIDMSQPGYVELRSTVPCAGWCK